MKEIEMPKRLSVLEASVNDLIQMGILHVRAAGCYTIDSALAIITSCGLISSVHSSIKSESVSFCGQNDTILFSLSSINEPFSMAIYSSILLEQTSAFSIEQMHNPSMDVVCFGCPISTPVLLADSAKLAAFEFGRILMWDLEGRSLEHPMFNLMLVDHSENNS
jgi:hypothetical protein